VLLGLSAALLLLTGYDAAMVVANDWAHPNLLRSFPLVFMFALTGAGLARQTREEASGSTAKQLGLMAGGFSVCLWGATTSLGGAQWGPRYLLPVFPLLVILAVQALHRLLAARDRSPLELAAVRVTFALLLTYSIVIQLAGVRHLWTAKNDYEALATSVQSVGETVIVTDLWWFPQVTAAITHDETVFLINYGEDDRLVHLLPRFQDSGVRSFTFVGQPETAAAEAANLARTQWTERSRHVERLSWLDVLVVTYDHHPVRQ
jgi:hypothetical protein